MNKKNNFTKPDVFGTFAPAPENIKKKFFARVIPYNFIKYTMYLMSILFISPIILVVMNLDLMKDEKVFYPIFWTLCVSFVIYTILAGAILVFYKIPYMQELKDKLGYTEK